MVEVLQILPFFFLPKKGFTESIIPSPYICCFAYFPVSGSYFFKTLIVASFYL